MALPTNMGMDFLFRNISDNYDKVRNKTSFLNLQFSRASLMSSTKSSVIYHKRIEMNNNLESNIEIESIDSPQLLYVTPKKQVNQVSTAVDSNNNTKNQYVPIEGPALNSSSISSSLYIDNNNVINIQLLYNSNRSTEPDLWNGNFHPISLYGLLKHLVSNADSIRKSITYTAIYIKNKNIETAKSNDIKDFKGISKVAWELISSIYKFR